MYAHDSMSRVTSIEWIAIHVLSEVQVMTCPSFQAGCTHIRRGGASACDLGHSQIKKMFDSLLQELGVNSAT